MARQFHHLGQSRHRPIVVRLARRATEIDPGYARAWALLALSQSNIRLLTGGYHDTGWEAAEKALALDPNLAEAHAARGRILADAGKYDEANAAHERALALDPESYDVNTPAARCLMSMGRNDRAVVLLEKAAEVNPNDVWSLGMAIQAYEALGNRDAMLDVARRCLARVEKVIAVEPDHTIALSFGITSLAALGERDRAMEWATRSELIDPDDINLIYNNACSMVTLREFDMALKLLERPFMGAVEQNLNWFRTDSSLDPIRGDARFQKQMGDLARRLNVPLAQREV
jgi:adenylate cyclase